MEGCRACQSIYHHVGARLLPLALGGAALAPAAAFVVASVPAVDHVLAVASRFL